MEPFSSYEREHISEEGKEEQEKEVSLFLVMVRSTAHKKEDSTRIENEKIEEIQTPYDGETEGDANMQEAATEELDGEKDVEEEDDGKEKATGETEKRQGGRRRLLKPALATGASNKLKMAKMVINKRMAAKTGSRQGDHSKQVEEKGTSNPNTDPAKQ
ncbi:hypothetical protein F2Q69_00043393 [Brassica cretica]|uniref:Uncharacterized protein n=1 Tax=Brassica cretica TaxID=69181 RepID=A0A8S9NHV4_BRACR|nr:hypothetical protein F2Q69_00043393 [Brassica cretica]